MLSALEKAKRNGAHIVTINPLDEAGLRRFRNPQTPCRPGQGHRPRRRVPAGPARPATRRCSPLWRGSTVDAGAVDEDFVAAHCSEYDEYLAAPRRVSTGTTSWPTTGLPRDQIEALAKRYRESDRVIVCWAMGLTQHRDAVATIQEITNLMLLRGNIGKPGAGLCPVRGHSNVQGDRTMGIWEKAPDWFLDALGHEFGFDAAARARPGRRRHDPGDARRARCARSSRWAATSSPRPRTPHATAAAMTRPGPHRPRRAPSSTGRTRSAARRR